MIRFKPCYSVLCGSKGQIVSNPPPPLPPSTFIKRVPEFRHLVGLQNAFLTRTAAEETCIFTHFVCADDVRSGCMEEAGPAGVDSTLMFENPDNMVELPIIKYDQKQVWNNAI